MKLKLAIVLLHLASVGLDTWSTQRNHNLPWREVNPIMRPFVGHAASQAAIELTPEMLSLVLHKTGHHKLEMVPLITMTGANAWGTATSLENHHETTTK